MDIICCLCDLIKTLTDDGNVGLCNDCIIKPWKQNITNGRRAICCLNSCLVSLITFPVFIISIRLISSQTFDHSEIVDNWRTLPLIQIEMHDVCPQNMEILSKITIQGTLEGCICTSYSGRAFQEECPNNLLDIGCTTYPEQDPIVMYNWSQLTVNGQYDTVQICGLRGQQSFYTQLEQTIYTKEDCVKNNLYVCETSNQAQYFCTSDVSQCPITKLTISLNPIDEPGNEVISNGKYYMYISRLFPSTPLANISINQASHICQNKNEVFGFIDYNSLQVIEGSICDVDQMYINIFDTRADELLKSNNLQDYMKQTRPLYDILSQPNYNLFGVNYYKFDPICREQVWLALKDNNWLQNENYVLFSICLGVICFSLINGQIICCNELNRYTYKNCTVKSCLWNNIIQFSLEITAVVCNYLSQGYIKKMYENLALFTFECLDSNLAPTIANIEVQIDFFQSETYAFYIIILIILAQNLFSAILHLYLYRKKINAINQNRQRQVVPNQEIDNDFNQGTQQPGFPQQEYNSQRYQQPMNQVSRIKYNQRYQQPQFHQQEHNQNNREQSEYQSSENQQSENLESRLSQNKYQQPGQHQSQQQKSSSQVQFYQPNMQYYAHQQPNMPQQQHIQPMQDHYPPPL